MSDTNKKAVISKECIACGCCEKICPLNAISVYKGMYAVPDECICVGCGKCVIVCPAAVISIIYKEDASHEEKTLV